MAVQGGKLAEKLALRKAIGVYVDETELTVSQIALGPFGVVELANQCAPYQPDSFNSTLADLLKPLLPAKRASRVRVSIGLPALRVFFASRCALGDGSEHGVERLASRHLEVVGCQCG